MRAKHVSKCPPIGKKILTMQEIRVDESTSGVKSFDRKLCAHAQYKLSQKQLRTIGATSDGIAFAISTFPSYLLLGPQPKLLKLRGVWSTPVRPWLYHTVKTCMINMQGHIWSHIWSNGDRSLSTDTDTLLKITQQTCMDTVKIIQCNDSET